MLNCHSHPSIEPTILSKMCVCVVGMAKNCVCVSVGFLIISLAQQLKHK